MKPCKLPPEYWLAVSAVSLCLGFPLESKAGDHPVGVVVETHTICITNGLTGCHNPPRYLRWEDPNVWTWPDEDCLADLLDAQGTVVARAPAR